MKNNIISELEWYSRQKINATFQIIAKTLLEIDLDQKKLNISELASKSFTTASSITRFCNQLGYDGYKELINRLYVEKEYSGDRQDRSNKNVNWTDDNVFNSSFENLIKNMREHNEKYYAQLLEIAQEIVIKEKIYLLGGSENYHVIQSLYKNLLKLNLSVFIISDKISFKKIIKESLGLSKSIFIPFLFGSDVIWIHDCISILRDKVIETKLLCSQKNFMNYNDISEIVVKLNETPMFECNERELVINYLISQLVKLISNKLR